VSARGAVGLRSTLSLREVVEMLLRRGFDVTPEKVRKGVLLRSGHC